MIIKWEAAEKMMDAIAYTLCRTVCHGEEFSKISDKEIADYVNNTTRRIFMDFCDENGIDKVEE